MGDTIIVRKDNVELTVPADQKDRYLKLGYNVYTEDGKIVEEAPITDIGALQLKVSELLKENAELKAALAKAKKSASQKKEA